MMDFKESRMMLYFFVNNAGFAIQNFIFKSYDLIICKKGISIIILMEHLIFYIYSKAFFTVKQFKENEKIKK